MLQIMKVLICKFPHTFPYDASYSIDIPLSILLQVPLISVFLLPLRDPIGILMLNLVLCEQKRKLFLKSVALDKTAALFDLLQK